ncbi:MAG: hypothetical protein COT71_00260 [Candidatus Andersenbacteria bacterium CG10_big_fil_rev_8_21_14_0_10_54_11]|uniref:PilN domain-containing protein n=1 Tax=Candidatus Andersenbacteria bacterium CG10_big_fil_rev_8_21_14_0_10_54_11 TaxID=1974485 RepID=A0A2M6X0I2_9BACT|nr:MAG: hypothetical protein COT71_00260 [Candidatus Andersenbacteria bacterium CG10_big_fil_rev_8_21_14_0_10_54_11]
MRYLNLLPPERRAALGHERLFSSLLALGRTLLAGLLLLTFTGFALGFGLRVLLATSPTDATPALLEQVRQFSELRNAVDRSNALVEDLAQLGEERVLWSRVLASLLAVVPDGTHIDHIHIDAAAQTLTLSGIAPNRLAVVALETELRSLAWVAAVNAAENNLLERLNPQYQFELEVDATAAHSL